MLLFKKSSKNNPFFDKTQKIQIKLKKMNLNFPFVHFLSHDNSLLLLKKTNQKKNGNHSL